MITQSENSCSMQFELKRVICTCYISYLCMQSAVLVKHVVGFCYVCLDNLCIDFGTYCIREHAVFNGEQEKETIICVRMG